MLSDNFQALQSIARKLSMFFDPSEKALETKAVKEAVGYKYQAQFEGVPVGKVFIIPMNEIALTTIRPLVSKIGKKLKRKFKLIVHDDMQKFEILRLPDELING